MPTKLLPSSYRVDRAQLVQTIVSDVAGLFANAALSQRTHDAFSSARSAVEDVLAAQAQLDRDRAELAASADLLPAQGYERLLREAVTAAHERAADADRRWNHALGELREAVVDDALPRLDPARESLARQELEAALGDATGQAARARLMRIAERGGEGAAALFRSGYGRTLLEARGLEGRELDSALHSARVIAAGVAAEHGRSDRERIAGAALGALDRFAAARGAAGVVR